MDKMADIEVNLCAGGGIEKVQLASLIAAFQCVRDDIKN